MIFTHAQIAASFPWAGPRRVQTKLGPRDLYKAPYSERGKKLFSENRPQLYAAGVNLQPAYKDESRLEFVWWKPVDPNEDQIKETIRKQSAIAESTIEVPAPPGITFREYQKAGIQYALGCFDRGVGCLLADDMGLGKTPQVIGVVNSVPSICNVLVVCPASIRVNWFREIKRFQSRPMTVGVVDGGHWPLTDWVIISYDLCHKWKPRTESKMWDLLVLDETHYISNPNAKRTKAIVGWMPRRSKEGSAEISTGIPTRRRMALSGTPMSNRPRELYTIIGWLDKETWPAKQYFQFAMRYCGARIKDEWGNKMLFNDSGASNQEELGRRLRESIMIRRLKTDVLKELPPKTRQIFRLTLSQKQRGEVKAAESAMLAKLDPKMIEAFNNRDADGLERLADMISEMTPAEQSAGAEARKAIGLAKIDSIIEHVEERLGQCEKLLVFAHHREVLERLFMGLMKHKPVLIYGATQDRQTLVDRFQADPSCRVAVLGIRAAGVGLNLPAASVVVMAEPDWTPGWNCQAEDRAHRYGQKNPVFADYLVADDSIDGVIVAAVIRKMANQEKILNQTNEI